MRDRETIERLVRGEREMFIVEVLLDIRDLLMRDVLRDGAVPPDVRGVDYGG